MYSELRAKAREKLAGKWGKAAFISFIYFLIFFLISFVQGSVEDNTFFKFLISILLYVIEIPLSFGLIMALFKLFKNEDVSALSIFDYGFTNFSKSWSISLRIILKMILPLILIVASYILFGVSFYLYIRSSFLSIYSNSTSSVGLATFLMFAGLVLIIIGSIWGTMKFYYYQLAYLISIDNPDMLPADAVLKSKELMTNNRGKLFCLQLSFIGWAILGVFTLGIGYFWLIPYIQFANICFYEKLVNNEE